MASAKVLAMRAADAARRDASPTVSRTCARADCELPSGSLSTPIELDKTHRRYVRLRNTNFKKEGDLYVHVDRRICEAVAASREAARRQQAPANDGAGHVSDLLPLPRA